ncbi:MAG: transcription-repair coupling factor, partial [Sterolibacterium sp.]|nr:transcription-repair coupling factor [Sterolibacterium sp.]
MSIASPRPGFMPADIRLPKPGAHLDLPMLAGSADALCISQLATDNPGHLLLVVTASPLDAQRLHEEIRWFAPNLRAHLLPDWETLPYDSFSPHQDLISERLATLYAISQENCDILLTAASTALTRLAPPDFLAAHSFSLKKGEPLAVEKLRAQLALAGYQHVTQVVAPGEYSVRGGLIDLFPMGAVLPFRIDLFDEEIESIRTFDADTQRTLYPVPEIRMLPAREFPLNDAPNGGRSRFRQRFREVFGGEASRTTLYKDVSNGVAPGGIEYYLPLFFEEHGLATLFDYLPEQAVLVQHHDVPGAIAGFWHDTRERHRMMSGEKNRPVLPPEAIYLTDEEFFTRATRLRRLVLPTAFGASLQDAPLPPPPHIAVDRRANDPLALLRGHLANHAGRTLLLAESPGRRETISEYLAEHALRPETCSSFQDF